MIFGAATISVSHSPIPTSERLHADQFETFFQAGEAEGAMDVRVGVGDLQFATGVLGGFESGDDEVQAGGINHAGLRQIKFYIPPATVFIAG